MRKFLIILTSLVFTTYSFSQIKKDTTQFKELKEVVVSSSRFSNNNEVITNQVESITKDQIEFQNFQNTADLLLNSGSLNVQKSQQGGGSPNIRGFEASRVLILIDGIRMNNLIFRSGHLQNLITIDETLIDNVTVFFGPTSTLFGSDALGGTINITTKKPQFLIDNKNNFSGNTSTRYSSVNEEKSGDFEFNFAAKRWATLTTFSYNDFSDLKMGKSKNHGNSFFGERPFFVKTINGNDVLVENSNKYSQKNSGYKQYNYMQKIAYKSQKGFNHLMNFQYSNSSNIPRYDRLTDVGSSGLKNAEWFYGPQKRLLAIYTIDKQKAFLGSNIKVDIAYQNIKESRHNRRFGNYNLQNRLENVNMYSISVDLHKNFKNSELFYGFESYYEDLKSTAYSNNIFTEETIKIDSRYPNGKNNMMRNDVYISYTNFTNKLTSWNLGVRIGHAKLKSTIADDSLFPLPFNQINQKNFTYSGTIGLVHRTSKNIDFKTNISSGFRVPNIDDLAKIFESGGGFVIVPNKDIKPEKTITADLGMVIKSNSKRFQFENTYYFTRFIDAIVTDNYTYNGETTINYNGSESQVLANQNKRRAFITGISSSVRGFIISNISFNANFNYTLGRITSDKKRTPLDHIAPFYGKLGLSYAKKWGNIEAYMLYNGKKSISDYFLNGEDNEQYAPKGGMPAWETYNFKTAIKIVDNTILYIGIENILDTQYRVFASGINAPGRNIYGGLKYDF
jgi:hemoglobin/transferrin/lactoferrin receptor protein